MTSAYNIMLCAALVSGGATSGPATALPPSHEPMVTYQEALSYLSNGAPTLAVFEAGKCISDSKTGAPQVPPGSYGAFRINGFISIPNKAIAFSDSHLVVTPDGTVRTELVVYHIGANNDVKVDIHFLAPGSYASMRPPEHYVCKLGDGVRLEPIGR